MKRAVVLVVSLVAGCGSHPVQLGGAGQPVSCGDAGSAPVALATEQSSPVSIAVTDSTVYWSNNGAQGTAGSVMSVPRCGGTPTTIATFDGWVEGLALTSSSVVWAEGSPPNSILSAPLGGGAPTTIAVEQGASKLVVDAVNVYWVTDGPGYPCEAGLCGNGAVVKVPLSGGAVTTLTSGVLTAGGGGTATDGANVYWVAELEEAHAPGGAVLAVPVGGGAVSTLFTVDDAILGSDLAIDAENLYFASQAWTGSSTPGVVEPSSIVSLPKGGGSPTTLATGREEPGAMTTGGGHLYWVESGGECTAPPSCNGLVLKVPVGGGAVVTLASGQYRPGPIAVDTASVYWSAAGSLGGTDSTVYKLTPN